MIRTMTAAAVIVCLTAAHGTADPAPIMLPHDRDLYFVTAEVGARRDGQLQHQIAPTQIARLECVTNEVGGVQAATLVPVQTVAGTRVEFVSAADNFIAIGNTSNTTFEVHFVSTQAPSTRSSHKMDAFSAMSFVEISGKTQLASYTFWGPQREPNMLLIDPQTLKTTSSELSVWSTAARDELLAVTDRGLVFAREGLQEVVFKHQPPRELLGAFKRFRIIANTQDFVLLAASLSDVAESQTQLVLFDKQYGKWRAERIKGDRTDTKLLGPWIACRVGWSFPEESTYGPVYTGEWLLIDRSGERQQTILSTNDQIIFADAERVMFTRGTDLIHVPVFGGEVSWRDALPICSDRYMNEVKFVFWGPKLR